MAVKVVTDSTCHLEPQCLNELKVSQIPLYINFLHNSIPEPDLTCEQVFNMVQPDKPLPTSSQPSPADFLKVYEYLLAGGHQIITITLSSEVSGTYTSAQQARDLALEAYPQAQIAIVDSGTSAAALGMLTTRTAHLALEGLTLGELALQAEKIKQLVHEYIVPFSLEYLIRGGRLKGAGALLGTMLKIRPVLAMEKGKVLVTDKTRCFSNALKLMLARIDHLVIRGGLSELVVQHICNPQTAQELADLLKSRYLIEVKVLPGRPAIGLQMGPGTVAIALCTQK